MAVYVNFDVPVDLVDNTVEALEVARDTGIVKKGVNETTRPIERDSAQLVLVAESIPPGEVAMHLPELADEKGISSIFVGTQDDIDHTTGLEVGSAAAAIVGAGDVFDDVEDIVIKAKDPR